MGKEIMTELGTIYGIRGRIKRNICDILILLVDYLAKYRMAGRLVNN
jgi:hypothetical protein